jgi:superfamily II DNA/RNA helicase
MSETQAATTFADLNLPEPLARAIAQAGYETPSPIQAECIPLCCLKATTSSVRHRPAPARRRRSRYRCWPASI